MVKVDALQIERSNRGASEQSAKCLRPLKQRTFWTCPPRRWTVCRPPHEENGTRTVELSAKRRCYQLRLAMACRIPRCISMPTVRTLIRMSTPPGCWMMSFLAFLLLYSLILHWKLCCVRVTSVLNVGDTFTMKTSWLAGQQMSPTLTPGRASHDACV